MNIKKIRWKVPGKDQGRPLVAFDDEMGLGFRASIMREGSFYQWKIYSKAMLLSMGESDTIKGAKVGCQADWERGVMEVLEPETEKTSKCKFCNDPHDLIHDLKGYPQYNDFTAKIDENGPSIDVHYVVNGIDRYEYMDIDYCPMCGRKL